MKRSTNKLGDIRTSFRNVLSGTFYNNESDDLFWNLIEEYSGMRRAEWLSESNPRLPESVIRDIERASSLLKKWYHLQHITGKAYFMGLELHIDKNVLIPRPETEELTSLVISEHKNDKKIDILDIGTGSGCIAIALAKELPFAKVAAMDISEKALRLAEENADSAGAEIDFFRADILDNSWFNGPERYDVIVSNPPYVRKSEKVTMRENVTGFEPHTALFVPDDDPFRFYRAILDYSEIGLEWGGMVYFEINEFLHSEMETWLTGLGYSEFEFYNDMKGKTRILKIRL
jgi:release factor glutamine methyltransferase